MLIALLAAAAAAAQPAPPQGSIIDRERLDHRAPAAGVGNEPARNKASIDTTGTGRPIEGIAFRGAKAPPEVARAAQRFIGRPATRDTLVELAAVLTRAYEDSDVALYTIAIPKQSFDKNVVVVSLTEGWIDSAEVRSSGPKRFPLLQAQMSRMVGEKPLARRTMERQFSLMRAIPGLTFEQSFDNPDGDDALKLAITPKQKRAKINMGVGNRGPDLLGDLLLEGRAQLFRLMTDGDNLSFNVSGSRDFRRYRQFGLSYASPIGADGLTLSASGSWVRTRPRRFDIEGTARLASVSLTYPLIRTFKRAADISIGVDGVNSDNAAFGNVVATERTRAIRVAGGYAAATDKSTLSASASLSRGLDVLGARTDRSVADAKFTKLSGTASFERRFGKHLLGRATLTAQHSTDRLPAAELFAVGGASVGRAFDTAFLTGDSGIGGSIELAFRPIRSGSFGTSELYLFSDAAMLKIRGRQSFPDQKFDLASAGAGARLRFKELAEVGLEAATIVDRPYPTYRGDWRLSFYYGLGF
jgi:hemolysin activation/secretion protein